MEDLIREFLSVGYGDGSGSGYDDGIKEINGETVYLIDNVPTVIRQIHGNIARGAIVGADLNLTGCYVIKEGNFFAHGETMHAAAEALQAKLIANMSSEERILLFRDHFRSGVLYPNSEFFDWHHLLTGSCVAGRRAFARDHEIDLRDSMTPEDFIRLTANAYGGEIIQAMAPNYGVDLNLI